MDDFQDLQLGSTTPVVRVGFGRFRPSFRYRFAYLPLRVSFASCFHPFVATSLRRTLYLRDRSFRLLSVVSLRWGVRSFFPFSLFASYSLVVSPFSLRYARFEQYVAMKTHPRLLSPGRLFLADHGPTFRILKFYPPLRTLTY
jgi:hypothetical protein